MGATGSKNVRFMDEISFAELLIGFIIVWVVASLWIMFFKNLFFKTLKLNENSTFQTFMIALVFTLIFLLLIYLIGTQEMKSIEKEFGDEE